MFDLNAKLGLDTTDFEKGIKRAQTGLAGLNQSIKQTSTVVTQARPSVIGLSQSLRDAGNFAISAQTGFLAISNNLPTVIDDFTNYRKQLSLANGTQASFTQTLKGFAGSLVGPAGISIALGVAATAIPILIGKYLQAQSATKSLIKETYNFSEAIKESVSEVSREAGEVTKLKAVLESEVTSRRQKNAALKELQNINPEIFNGLKIEEGLVSKLNDKYQTYIATLKDRVEVARLEKKINDLINQQLARREDKDIAERFKTAVQQYDKLKPGFSVTVTPEIEQLNADQALKDAGLEKSLQETFDKLTKLADKIKIKGGTEKVIKLDKIVFDVATIEFKNGQPALQAALEELRKKTIAETNPAVNVPLQLTIPQAAFDALKKFGENEYWKKIQENTQGIINQFDQFLTPVINTAFEALGNGSNIIKAIGQSLKALVVQIGITIARAAILSAILNSIFPGGAAIGGKTVSGFGNIFKSILGFGQTASPNFGGVTGGGVAVNVGGSFNIRGTDLVAVVQQSNQRIGRTG